MTGAALVASEFAPAEALRTVWPGTSGAVAVPTPVDKNNVPDLTPVLGATEIVGRAIGVTMRLVETE